MLHSGYLCPEKQQHEVQNMRGKEELYIASSKPEQVQCETQPSFHLDLSNAMPILHVTWT